MSKHTPGPWRVNDKIAVVEQDEPLGLFVADCRMTDEGRANARLIAAAPELLEVLKAFIEQEVDYMTTNDLGDPEQQHNIIWARKIIAKAEGKP